MSEPLGYLVIPAQGRAIWRNTLEAARKTMRRMDRPRPWMPRGQWVDIVAIHPGMVAAGGNDGTGLGGIGLAGSYACDKALKVIAARSPSWRVRHGLPRHIEATS